MSVEVRAAREDDTPALGRFLDEHALAVFGESELSEEEVRHWFTLPGIWMRVAERDRQVAGYVDVVARDGGTRFDADARTLDREAAGWRVIRQSYRMRIELDSGLAEPRWPDGISVRTLVPGEEERVSEVHMEAFADHWDFRRQTFDAESTTGAVRLYERAGMQVVRCNDVYEKAL